MDLNIFILILTLFNIVIAGKHDIYSGYSVYRVTIRDSSDRITIEELMLNLDLDIWEHGSPGTRNARIMVSPDQSVKFLRSLEDNGIRYQMDVPDVAMLLEKEDETLLQWRQRRNGRVVPFDDYPRYAEVNEYMERIAAEYPDLVTLVNAGPSFEGRDIKYVKISSSNFSNTSKPIYFLDAMIHAREWVTTPVALYTVHRLVEDLREKDRDLLEDIDWIVLPIVNPDGYEYTHTHFRLWRRTRSFYPEINDTCYGVDANRNFDIFFNKFGVSSDPCSDIYPGPAAFSEKETQYVKNILDEYIDRIQLYMNIHSHGNWVLFSYGDSSVPSNVMQLHLVGAAMGAAMDALKLHEADYYAVGNSALLLYGASGCADDYAHSVGVPLSYTLELPGYGRNFVVPPEYINHINQETWEGIATSARFARAFYNQRLRP